MPDRIVAIHQPNFFPWLGYFDKIRRADVFVFLDDVQFPKKGGSWSNRVRILNAGAPAWLTAPVDRSYSGFRTVLDMRYAEGVDWRAAQLRTLQAAYARAPFFAETSALIEPLLSSPVQAVAEYNIGLVETIAQAVGIAMPRPVRSSALGLETASTQRLIDICRAVGCNVYLSGGGAQGYQDEAMFAQAGIELRHQNFVHPLYAQAGASAFVPGLSIVDALMNRGIDAVSRWLAVGGGEI